MCQRDRIHIVLDEYNGYISMPTSDDLYKAIKKAIDNIDNTQIIRNAVDCVEKSFSKAKWSMAWENILRDIISEQ